MRVIFWTSAGSITQITAPQIITGGSMGSVGIANVQGLQAALDARSLTTHAHTWNQINNKPTTYTPEAHDQAIGTITGLQAALNSKAETSHGHDMTAIGGLVAALSGKAAQSHEHPISEVTGLQAALNSVWAAITDLQQGTETPLTAPITTVAATITGVGQVGELLTANVGTANGNPVPTYAVQWYRNGAAIAGANSVSHLVTSADGGHNLVVRVTWSNSEGSTFTEASIAISASNTLPYVISSPTISGGTQEGVILTVAVGSASGAPLPVSSIQWLSNGATIAGAIGATLNTSGLVGQTISVRVTWANAAGTVSATSNSVTIIEQLPVGPPLLYEFDWESGLNTGNDGWDAASTAIVTTPAIEGTYAARVTGGTAGWGFILGLDAPVPELFISQKVRLDVTVNPTVDHWYGILQIGNTAGWPFVLNHDCYPNGDSMLDAWIGPADQMTGPSVAIPRNQTFDLDVRVLIATTGGRFVVRVNGAVVIDFTGNTGSANVDRINFLAQADNVYGATFTHTFDNMVASDEDWPIYGTVEEVPIPPSGAIVATGAANGLQPARLGLSNSDGDYLFSSYGSPATIMADVASVGAKWVRSDIRISRIRSSRGGTPSWSFYDTMVDIFTEGDKQLMPILMPGGWLGESMATTTNRNDFRNHCVEVVARYKDRVKHWQIMNELNHSKKMTPENYAALLQLVYPAMKTEDPDCFIITQGTSSIELDSSAHYGARSFIQRMFQAGAGSSFDALAHHPYTVWEEPNGWQNGTWHGWNILYDLHDFLVSQGQGHKQIWVTEYGQAVQGSPDGTDEDHQLDTLQQAYDRLVRDNRFGPLFIYTHRDREIGADDAMSETWWGLKSRAGVQRPAYTRFVQISARDDNARVLRPAAGTYDYFAGRLFDVPGNPRRQGVSYTMTPLTGVSINASTGIVTITNTATAGTVTITGTLNGLSATATLQIVTS